MKKIIIIILSVFFSGNLFSQNEAVYTARDTAHLLKQTVFNTARFLSFDQPSLKFSGLGYGVDVPGLTYTFTLTKNTVIQISESVLFSTICDDCVITKTVTWFKNSIVINKERFASFDAIGVDLFSSSGGTVLAQLGPGTHTIKIHVAIREGATDATIYGYDKDRGNRTFMSLLFFEQ